MKQLSLLDGKIEVNLDIDPTGKIERGTVSDELQESCNFCGQTGCYHSCDESTACFDEHSAVEQESEDEVACRMQFNAAIDGITALVLAQACAGIDVEDAKYQETLQTCLDAVGNYYA